MDRETARQTIKASWRDILAKNTSPAKTKVSGELTYICPLCGHGHNGEGIMKNPKSIDGNGLKCFDCGFSGDVIDLFMQLWGEDYNTVLSLLADELGITIDKYQPATTNEAPKSPNKAVSATGGEFTTHSEKIPQKPPQEATEANSDFSAYYESCRKRLNAPAAVEYLKNRGISIETAAAYWLGFDPEWKSPTAIKNGKNPPATPRLIIPTSKSHYVARTINQATAKQYAKMNEGSPAIFNQGALYAEGVHTVFVTEGVFDALSVIEAGATAIALNSTSNAAKLLNNLSLHRTDATLIICLDNDPAGTKAAKELQDGLKQLNISSITANICNGHKDPNESLQADREAFKLAVARAIRQTSTRPDNISYYIDNLMNGEIARFKREIKTGYGNLDEKTGGLYSGLYVIAAISSLGKTTFALQMADQIAAKGRDVLFFSLEQSRLELVSKSIARRTAINNKDTAVSSLSIRRGNLPDQAVEAAEQYKQEVQEHLSIIEGNFSCNISFIGNYIKQYMARNESDKTGNRPVVFIDYLQILQPAQQNSRQGTKEIIDTTITDLKRISRDLDITVFVISSVNRTNYLTPIDFESIKESGNIEYTADVVFGLQLKCITQNSIFGQANGSVVKKRDAIREAKAASPRAIELICLKNRYGISSFSCYFDYYPENDLFRPVDETISVDPKSRI